MRATEEERRSAAVEAPEWSRRLPSSGAAPEPLVVDVAVLAAACELELGAPREFGMGLRPRWEEGGAGAHA